MWHLLPLWFRLLAGALYGAPTGSFSTVLIERLARKEAPTGRSRCICGRELSLVENIPIVSWLVLRGQARCCGAPIPRWYLAMEIGFAALGAGLAVLPLPLPVIAIVGVAVWTAIVVAGIAIRRYVSAEGSDRVSRDHRRRDRR